MASGERRGAPEASGIAPTAPATLADLRQGDFVKVQMDPISSLPETFKRSPLP